MIGSPSVGASGRARMSGVMQRSVGNARIARMAGEPFATRSRLTVQAKLTVNTPGDVYEREADSVSDRITQSGRQPAPVGRISRLPSNGMPTSAHHQAKKEDAVSGGLDSSMEARIQSPAGGRPLAPDLQREMESGLGTDLSAVRVHDSAPDRADADHLNAKAFTHGSDIWIGSQGTGEDRKLMAHELTHVVQQTETEPAALSIQREDNPPSNIARLNEMLDRWNVPEEDVIALLGQMNPAEKAIMLVGYKSRIASALNIGEMVRAVNNLGPPLEIKLDWVEAAATFNFQIDYSDIKGMVTGARQPERDALKTARWQGFFVDVCTNTTMIEAVTDLGFNLKTKLVWVRAEVTSVRLELSYGDIKPLVTAAPQGDRDALKTDEWRDFFVQVCDNTTIFEAVNNLGFDLKTKLEWVSAEMTWIRAELSYSQIKPLITSATQADRDTLKTDDWRDFFVKVCTNATMAEAVDDLGWNLATKLDWMITEGTDYSLVKPKITAASAGDKATALADQALLRKLEDELSWNDFAKSVELLGRAAPTAAAMLADATVSAAMSASFAASSPALTCNLAPGTPAPAGVHEEVAWIYMNLITGSLHTRRAPSGGQANGTLSTPPEMDDSITVGAYHTHPNVGPCWGAVFASAKDITAAVNTGVPLLIIGAFPAVANTQTISTGPQRTHLAGNRGFPGGSGGETPQATLDGTYDEV
jgi:hypothetical protein